MRIYEGSPRQDFEEVFRSIGAFIDQRGMHEVLLVEAPDGFIVQGFGLLTPLSWWIEGVRQSLFPGGITSVGGEGSLFQTLTGQLEPTGGQIVLALLATGTVATLASIAVFRASDRRAKDRGLLDQTTGS